MGVDSPVRGAAPLLRSVDLAARAGEVLALIGPNGAGKSTLLRALSGELRPSRGRVLLRGRPLAGWPPPALARARAVMEQQVSLAFPLPAREVVALGRLPWRGTPGMALDRAAVGEAMERAGVAALAARTYATLSGGERQRVQFARALAQLHGAAEGALLLMDEPTASLDPRHRGLLLRAARGLARDGLAVILVLHDLNEAAFVADRVGILAEGRLVASGPAAAVLRREVLREVYGIAFRPVEGGLLPDLAG
nr:heme ABC transporter ATP-binding protein [Roseomonas acroporae]